MDSDDITSEEVDALLETMRPCRPTVRPAALRFACTSELTPRRWLSSRSKLRLRVADSTPWPPMRFAPVPTLRDPTRRPHVTDRELQEVEKVLLHISDARTWTQRATEALGKDGASPHVVDALRSSEQDLAAAHQKLSQATYYAVPEAAPKLPGLDG